MPYAFVSLATGDDVPVEAVKKDLHDVMADNRPMDKIEEVIAEVGSELVLRIQKGQPAQLQKRTLERFLHWERAHNHSVSRDVLREIQRLFRTFLWVRYRFRAWRDDSSAGRQSSDGTPREVVS